MPSELSITTRLGMLHAHLLTPGQIRDLIIDAYASNLQYMLPDDLIRSSGEMLARGEIKFRES